MDDHPVTLENDLKPTQRGGQPPVDAQTQRTKGMKFTYPSGSQPLEGYTIKRGIGIGGFGEVYFALSDAGKEVALKKIQRNLDIELRGVRQCLNLKHVNLISLWDIRSSEQGESWVVMEYVPGNSLQDVIEQHPQGLPDDKLRHWFDSVAAGVTYLHNRGIVHRDLKPGNIFRDDDEQVIKIGDYGLSKFISCSNRDGQTESVGTFHYMAPEIGKGVYGKEIDVYAMGIILFEMLTGRVPFEGESSQEIIMKHLTADPDLRGLREPYRSVIQKALTKDPERRFRSIPDMMKAINGAAVELADDRKPGARPPIQPMFIGDDRATDSEISFGEVREVVDASHPGGTAHPADSPRPARVAIAEEKLHDEPIARAVQGSWRKTNDWWTNANLTTPVKIFILTGAGILLLLNGVWLLPVSLGLGMLYLIYFTIRSCFQSGDESPKPRMTRSEKVNRMRASLATRPVSDRFTEAIGSLVVSSMVCLVLGFFTLMATSDASISQSQQWAFYAWSVIVAIVASWSLLLSSKTWEHRNGEAVMRRFVMLSLGVGVGVIAYVAGQYLHLNWSAPTSISEPAMSPFAQSSFVEGDAPRLLGYVLYFSGLFVILRWWRQADPVRRTRLSIWSVGLCLVWGMMVGQFFHFPLPWSCVLAVMISVATQISSPWLSREQRHQLQHQTS